MSIDLIILSPLDDYASDLTEVDDFRDLASAITVLDIIGESFPGTANGLFSYNDEYAVEVMVSGDPVQSLHLTLHYGSNWSDESHERFLLQLSSVCAVLGAQAFAVSDNSRIELAAVF